MKVAIVGVGHVGAALAYTLLLRGNASEIVLVNRSEDKAFGEVLDLTHALASATNPVNIYPGDIGCCLGAAVVIVTAGAGTRAGQSRLEIVRENARLFKRLIPKIVAANPNGIILVVTNPVDVSTYLALRYSGLSPARVLGSGTVLDGQRFRSFLSIRFNVDPADIQAHVIGEHGDSMIPVWSQASVAGIPLTQLPEYDADAMADLFHVTKHGAAMVRATKESTQYATALSVAKVVEAILLDRKQVLTVSTLVRGYDDIDGVCLSLPAVVGRSGVERVLQIPLADDERDKLVASARVLEQAIASVADIDDA